MKKIVSAFALICILSISAISFVACKSKSNSDNNTENDNNISSSSYVVYENLNTSDNNTAGYITNIIFLSNTKMIINGVETEYSFDSSTKNYAITSHNLKDGSTNSYHLYLDGEYATRGSRIIVEITNTTTGKKTATLNLITNNAYGLSNGEYIINGGSATNGERIEINGTYLSIYTKVAGEDTAKTTVQYELFGQYLVYTEPGDQRTEVSENKYIYERKVLKVIDAKTISTLRGKTYIFQ